MGQKSLQKVEKVAAVDPNSVAFKDTTVGKTVRTFLQAAAGVLVLLATSQEFRDFITNNFPQVAVYLPLLAAFFTAIHNASDPNVKNF